MQLSLKQSQELQLTMNLQLRQAIELLQYSTTELETFIREQELKNPLIQLTEPRERSAIQTRYLPREQLIEKVSGTSTTIREELLHQVNCTYSNHDTVRVLHYIIHNLNNKGYFENHENNPFSEQVITEGIQLLQHIGPHGIGARSLQECLLLQCKEDPHCPNHAPVIISKYLEELGNKQYKKILQSLPIKLQELYELEHYIKSLQPLIPLNDEEGNFHITPDIIVEIRNNHISMFLNDRYLPKISIVPEYATILKNTSDGSSYLKKYYKEYNWLLTSIEQRRTNIIKVMQVLIQRQRNFFIQEEHMIEPLTLREVAQESELHESTVSRITNNKYVQTPFGTFELKKLFSSKLSTTNGDVISQNTVKSLLINYINQEKKEKPYTDQKIADYFNQIHGIEVSRRTIAKYREELNIPAASKRKYSSYIYK